MVAFYIVLEQKTSDLDATVSGKALAHAESELARIAAKLGIKPLTDFFSLSIEEAMDFLANENIDLNSPDTRLPELRWFTAADGLKTVRALMIFLEEHPNSVKSSKNVVTDLKEFEQLLSEIEKRKIQWHLAVDF